MLPLSKAVPGRDRLPRMRAHQCQAGEAPRPPAPPHAPDWNRAKHMSRRILLVEGNFKQAHVIARALSEAGFEFHLATDGRQGMRALRQNDFDLVISEIVLPGLTGFELCRKVKDDPARAHIPVILLTSLRSPLDI